MVTVARLRVRGVMSQKDTVRKIVIIDLIVMPGEISGLTVNRISWGDSSF